MKENYIIIHGFLAPSSSAEFAAGVLGIPAAIGTFDPNANSSLKNYAKNYIMLGGSLHLARAAYAQGWASDLTHSLNNDWRASGGEYEVGSLDKWGRLSPFYGVRYGDFVAGFVEFLSIEAFVSTSLGIGAIGLGDSL